MVKGNAEGGCKASFEEVIARAMVMLQTAWYEKGCYEACIKPREVAC